MSLTFERLYPLIFGLSVGVGAFLLDIRLPSDKDYLLPLLSSAISFSAILVGFLATVKSILMALPAVVAQLNRAQYMDVLASYLATSITSNLVFCILSLSGFFKWTTENTSWFSPIWLCLGAFSVLSFWRVMTIMSKLLRYRP
jgi:hypothetical protein